jgi:hypothetical protein
MKLISVSQNTIAQLEKYWNHKEALENSSAS